MTLLIGAIADDYTGASDLANTLTRNGLRTVQTIGVPDPGLPLPDIDAVVIALKIRSVASSDAVHEALTAERWLRHRGAGHVLYKICSTFDSTDDGNIGPVSDALLDAARAAGLAGSALALVTPAFPETGRTVYCGHLFVNGQPLHESPLKDHPLNPMRDANLPRVLARQTPSTVGLLDHATISAGPSAIEDRLQTLASAGTRLVIADAISGQDLLHLGASAAGMAVSVGASGLGLGLARALAPAERALPVPIEARKGHAAVIAGSCSAATLRQLERAADHLPVLWLDPQALLVSQSSRQQEIDRAMAWAEPYLGRQAVVMAASADPAAVSALQQRFGRQAAGHAIEQATSALAEQLVARGVRRLVIAGGETSGAAVDRLRIPAFLIGPEIAPGVPLLQTLGDRHGGLSMALKSGNFGGDDFFVEALRMMAV